jgi:hypothetical protein
MQSMLVLKVPRPPHQTLALAFWWGHLWPKLQMESKPSSSDSRLATTTRGRTGSANIAPAQVQMPREMSRICSNVSKLRRSIRTPGSSSSDEEPEVLTTANFDGVVFCYASGVQWCLGDVAPLKESACSRSTAHRPFHTGLSL